MVGKRVKLRLRVIAYGSYLVSSVLSISTFVGGIWMFARFGIPLAHPWWMFILLVIPPLLGCLAMLLCKAVSARLGWMTPREAQTFPWRAAWPENWLEQVNENHT
jgi:hypothetical protein